MFVYCCCTFDTGLFVNMRASVLHDLTVRTGSTASSIGVFLLLNGVGGALCCIPTGFAIDYIDPHRVIILGLGLKAISAALTPLSSSLVTLSLLGFTGGCSNALMGVSSRSCVVWLNDEYAATHKGTNRMLGASLNILNASFGFGSILGPLFYSAFETRVGQGTGVFGVYWVVSGIAMLTMFLIGFTSSPTRTPPSRETDRDGDDGGHDEGFIDDSVETGAGCHCSTRCVLAVLRQMFPKDSWHVVLLLFLFLCCSVATENFIASWLVELAVGTGRADGPTADIINSSLWIAFTTFGALNSFVSLLFPSFAILTVANAMIIGVLVCFMVWSDVWTTWLLAIGVGVGIAPAFPNGMALGRKYCVFTGAIQSLIALAANVGVAVPAVAGALEERYGWFSVIWLTMGGVAVMQCILMALVGVGTCSSKERDKARSQRHENLLRNVTDC